VSNRRAALKWIKANANSGVFYFGDDDNTFDLALFDQIRQTKIVSMFPVGLIGEFGVSAPIVEQVKESDFFTNLRLIRIYFRAKLLDFSTRGRQTESFPWTWQDLLCLWITCCKIPTQQCPTRQDTRKTSFSRV
jgi:hypothetical protein